MSLGSAVPVGRLALLAGCLETLERLRAVTRLLADRNGRDGRPIYPEIGPHLRHCVDHFRCLIHGLDRGEIDYDDRERHSSLERDPEQMLAAVEQLAAEFARSDDQRFGRPLRVRSTAAPGTQPAHADTTAERELLFVAGHTIHHLAIVALLAAEHGITLPASLTLAFSTAEHRERRSSPR